MAWHLLFNFLDPRVLTRVGWPSLLMEMLTLAIRLQWFFSHDSEGRKSPVQAFRMENNEEKDPKPKIGRF
jgi:hypothetical protein